MEEQKTPGLSFDFVGNEELRASLGRDARELSLAATHEAHKSALVLAGSIIETVLLDHLISTDHLSRTGHDPTTFEFWKLIETCREEDVISDRSKHLLHAVRDYRNLIHPGRSFRLKDHVTPGAAKVAEGIVQIVCTEMAERPNRSFGMKAEQVMVKVRHDPKILSMVDHLLAQLRLTELDRLIVEVIPNAFIEAIEYPDDESTVKNFERLYREAFKLCSDTAKTERLDKLCHAIKVEPAPNVLALLAHTVCGWHLQYTTPQNRKADH